LDKYIGADDIDEESVNKNDGFDFDKNGDFRFFLINNLYFYPAELTEKGVSDLRNGFLIERNNYIKVNRIQFNRLKIVRRGFIFDCIFNRRFHSILFDN
jgi:hypothetical protein